MLWYAVMVYVLYIDQLHFGAAQDLASQAQGLAQTAGDVASSSAAGFMK